MLKEQQKFPEQSLQDFDKYRNLLNGVNANNIFELMKEPRPFQEYCDLVIAYRDLEMEIRTNLWGVIKSDLYEFHRTGLISMLEMIARFLQDEILQKMVHDQQRDMDRLQVEYNEISDKALSAPETTAKLFESEADVSKIKTEIIPLMEDRLRVVSFGYMY